MKSKIVRRGGEVVVVIPPEILDEAKLEPERDVDVSVHGDGLVVSTRKRLTLAELLEGITEENRHPETDWGPDVGNERWEY